MSTKVHAAGDALGLPVRPIGTSGQRNDIALAHDLIEEFEADAVIADKGYDADHLVQTIVETGAEMVIPPESNRRVQRSYEKHLDRERNAVDRFFCRLKQFGRVVTRYDKLLADFMGFVKLAAIAIWLEWEIVTTPQRETEPDGYGSPAAAISTGSSSGVSRP